jgi:alpha-tubulin suppressor-like RCC1 family protein
VKKVACGGGHTGLITQDTGDLYLFGRGRDGQLGRGNKSIESSATRRPNPTLVEFFKDSNLEVEHIALGTNHTLATANIRSR